MKEIYRFRKADSLINTFKELQNQEIYFASPEELNDPMEGYRDMFWKGDAIVWKNFILNYVKSFEQVYRLYAILGESKPINENDIVDSFKLARGKLTQFNNQILKKICERIFKIPFILNLSDALAKRVNSIRRNELLAYLQIIHPFVIDSVSTVYFENGLTSFPNIGKDSKEFEKIMDAAGSLPELLNKMELENNNYFESFLSVIGLYSQTNHLMARKGYEKKIGNENSLFLFYEFSNKFVDKLITDIYPPWYSASFLSDCKNSAIWGHYGDNHKGICLIYNTTLNDKNEMQLNLKTEYGYSSGPIIGMRPHTFKKIKYQNAPTEIDFFRSIGRLTKFELEKLWYKDTDGNASICGHHLIEDEEEWRDQYWDNFFDSFSIKLKEWEYENEYRLVIHGDFTDYSEKNDRKLKYDFNDLAGIIFGIRTSSTDKIDVVKIIEEKCKENKRTDFKFYQAYYSRETRQIETFKLSNLLNSL